MRSKSGYEGKRAAADYVGAFGIKSGYYGKAQGYSKAGGMEPVPPFPPA